MGTHLVLKLHLHDARYHGGEWPPAPARVFQALVAGSARGAEIPAASLHALQWLEALPPPLIAAPVAVHGTKVSHFVPNNDADAVGGRQDRIAEIRTQKTFRPWLLRSSDPIVYAWRLPSSDPVPEQLLEIASDVYQLGRGIDMAWAECAALSDEALAESLAAHPGTVHRADGGDQGTALACPVAGSAASLVLRHQAFCDRLQVEGAGRRQRSLFVQPPRPAFATVSYNSRTHRRTYELRALEGSARSLWAWPLHGSAALVAWVRDGMAARLRSALPDRTAVIDACIAGRTGDGRGTASIERRVRIVPLPSIGHEHVDPAIRRVMVEVPAQCPLAPEDVHWACSGLELVNPDTGELGPVQLLATSDSTMAERFGGPAVRWRTITPIAVPHMAARGTSTTDDGALVRNGGMARMAEERAAVMAVRQALRHAGIRESVAGVHVQREPFDRRGARAEAFAAASRFTSNRLWHVELRFEAPREGMLLLGDGRFAGLGLLVPSDPSGMASEFRMQVAGELPEDDVQVARALRRAVMSLVQQRMGARPLPRFFTGHEPDGTPVRSQHSAHVAFHVDRAMGQLLVVPPHGLDRRDATRDEAEHIALLASVLAGLAELRISRSVVVRTRVLPQEVPAAGGERSATWESASAYTCTRHAKAGDVKRAITLDVEHECNRRGLPRPTVTVLSWRSAPDRGLSALVRLQFEVAVPGPVIIGRTRFLGGGRLVPV
jgi:CRISPR-associated protein Csb2